MVDTTALVSLCHTVRTTARDTRIAGQRGGVHFDAVFRGDVAAQARDTLFAHMHAITAYHAAHRTPTSPSMSPDDVFTQVVLAGDWYATTPQAGGEERLLLVVEGFSYPTLSGAVVGAGCLALPDYAEG